MRVSKTIGVELTAKRNLKSKGGRMQSGVLLKLIEAASGTNRFRDVVAREREKKRGRGE